MGSRQTRKLADKSAEVVKGLRRRQDAERPPQLSRRRRAKLKAIEQQCRDCDSGTRDVTGALLAESGKPKAGNLLKAHQAGHRHN
ncbi:hypothetical protein [Actinoplanes sp. NPDC049265]|uniref:hypothetical protein n=1 Tax=Actinoplanes sp. NPDC049265 TaxID=3363902 RepID=UPI0037170B53